MEDFIYMALGVVGVIFICFGVYSLDINFKNGYTDIYWGAQPVDPSLTFIFFGALLIIWALTNSFKITRS